MSGRGLEIAVTGMAGRFPGAAGVEALWADLLRGREAISRFSRAELLDAGTDPLFLDHPNFVPAGAAVEGADRFDAGFFGLTEREAELLDPQQRLLLECAWEALERAGHGGAPPGPVGVFVGASESTWLAGADASLAAALGRAQLDLAGNRDFLATRIAYKLGLHGPAVTVQTACSTSLVAIHLAAASLLAGDCDLALAGGASLRFPERSGYLYREGGIASPDGRCRPFDERARGTVAGAGVAVVVLRRLADALADGDPVHAVVRGSAINNDGARKVGYTAPSVDGQAEVIRAALLVAEVDPATVGYVEAHGTATPLGDPIEIAALKQAFGGLPPGRCAVGSIKGNLGHLDAAAGVAGFVKAALAVREGRIPPSLHVERPSPRLGLDGSPFRIAAAAEAWPDGGGPRRAGVSSFGIGGTNAHVVLEEPPPAAESGPSRAQQPVVLSARSEAALEAAASALAGHLETHPEHGLADVAATLARGRRPFAHRAAVVAAGRTQAIAALSGRAPGLRRGRAPEGGRALAFLFPGQGAQRPGAGRKLYDGEPAFRRVVDRCAEVLGPFADGRGLLDLLFPEPGDPGAAARLTRTAAAQPALFALEAALAALWREWGAIPQAMLGHSVGEYAAACLAGVFSLEDGVALLAARGRLMDALPAGAMLAVPQSAAEVGARLGGGLAVAAINGPELTAVSGPAGEVDRLAAELAAAGVATRRLHTSHAFHGPAMEPIVGAFAERVAAVALAPPRIPFVSNLTGTWIADAEATDPGYWARHLRQPVRFADGVAALAEEPARVYLEVGPGRALTALVRRYLASGAPVAVASLAPEGVREDGGGAGETEAMCAALGELWLAGAAVDWDGVYAHQRRRRLELPPYPFERRSYRLRRSRPAAAGAPGEAGAGAAPGTSLFRPLWQEEPAPPPVSGSPSGHWLVLADRGGLGERLAARLEAAGARVTVAAAAGEPGESAGDDLALDPGCPEDFHRLAAALGSEGPLAGVVHLWSLDAAAAGEDGGGEFAAAAERGFWSLERLIAALEGTGAENAPGASSWTVVTSGVAAVTGDEPSIPANALLLGPCWALPFRRPDRRCRVIDVAPPAGGLGAGGLDALAGRLLDELAAAAAEPAGPVDPLRALRGRRRFRRRLDPVAEARPAALRPRGVYWITGGLGGVGLALAGMLAGAAQARLVLTGRRGLPPREDWRRLAEEAGDPGLRERLARVLALEEAGAEVMVAPADVTRRDQMAAVLARVRERWGTPHGVIHAAGVAAGIDGGEEAAAAVLAPKVEGTRVLLDLLDGAPLDFLALCSSLASLRGGPAAGYCAASAFLDAVAEARAGRAPATVSLGWDTWSEVGGAAEAAGRETDPARRRRLAEHLAGGLGTDAALRAFHLALGAGAPHLAVSARAAAAEPASPAGAAQRPAASALHGPGAGAVGVEGLPAGAGRDEGAADGPAAEPANPVEAAIAGIWRELLGRDRVAADDDFFRLGGHSLLAAQLMNRIQERFGVDLPLAAIFEAPTVRRLAERVEPGRAAAGAPRGTTAADATTEAPASPPGTPPRGPRAAEPSRPGAGGGLAPETRGAGRPGVGRQPAAAPAAVPVELSLGQQRLWFLDRLEPGNPAYNLPGAFRLTGPLDGEALRAAFEALVRRQQALRTRFPADREGRATAIVEPPGRFPLPRVDLGALPAGRRLAEALRLAAAEAAAPFDLAAGPPIRAALVGLGDDHHVLLLTVHHVVSDLWSMGILLRELAALYAAGRAGRPAALPALREQFADLAARQRRALGGEALAAQAAYWREVLGGALPVLEIPADRPRPRALGSRGRRVPVALPAERSHALVEGARERGATLFMAVAAVYAVLLHRWGGQEDLTIGFPIAGRRERAAERLIGFFVNTLVLRLRLSGSTPFAALLADVRQRALDAFAHQDLPFERLVELLELPRDLGRTPVFQAMLGVLNAPVAPPRFPDLEWRPLAPPARTAQFELSLDLAERDGVVRGHLEVNADLFDAATAARMAAHFAVLAAAAFEHPETPVGALPLLGAGERHQLVAEWRGAGEPAPGTVVERIAAAAAAAPDRIAVATEDGALSYGALDARAGALARRLAARGVGVESRVGVLAERSPELIAALLAIHRAGAAYLPLPADAPRERLAALAADAGLELVLADRALAGRLPAGLARLPLDEAVAARGGGQPTATAPPPPDAAAYVLYTSGSTGSPKGVVVSHRALASFLAAVARDYALGPGDRVLQFAALGFDTSVEEVFATLAAGATLVLRDDLMLAAPADFAAACVRRQVTVLDLPTSYWHELAAAVDAGLPVPPAVRLAIVGGERLHAGRAAAWLRAAPGCRLIDSYGPTEATVAVTSADLGVPGAGGAPTIGRPIAAARLQVLDRRLEPVPIGVAGEIALGGPVLARGYLGRPAATAERFVPDPFAAEPGSRLYRTGDRGRRRADGRLEFAGRADLQVKVRGYRVEPGEVEAALLAHPGVARAAVLARDDGAGRRSLVAYVSPRIEPAALRAHLAARLPPHLVPAAFVALDELPLNASGKVDRRALPAPAEPVRAAPAGGSRAPAGALEERLAAIWRRVLGVERVGRDDNFFDLGGDSILSIQIVAGAAREGVRLAPRQLFEHQTVAELAAAVEAGEGGGRPPEPPEQGPLTGPAPLLPIQRWFLDADPPDPHHFNQSLLLAVDRAVPAAVLAAALTCLAVHHDALRSRFARGPGGWSCTVAPPGAVPFAAVDLGALPAARRRGAFAAAAAALQGSLDLGRGPLVRGARLDLGREGGCRLLVVAHHLVVDGVSWRILGEDLRRAVSDLGAGRAPRLPPKTASYRRWAERLAERAADPALAEEVAGALPPVPPAAAALPFDRPFDGPFDRPFDGPFDGPAEGDRERSTASVVTRLGAADTAALLRRGRSVGAGAGVEAVLLAALVEACAPWTGGRALLIDREGHGREEEAIGGADLSRTVGWFTAVHALLVDLAGVGLSEAPERIAAELRRAPLGGLGEGLVRHLGAAGGPRERLLRRPAAAVAFNYLGRLDEVLAGGGPFTPAPEDAGPQVSPRQARRYLLEVDAAVLGGRLQVVWRHGGRHRRRTVEALAERFAAALRRLAGSGRPAPDPEAVAALAPAIELDRVLAELEAAEETP